MNNSILFETPHSYYSLITDSDGVPIAAIIVAMVGLACLLMGIIIGIVKRRKQFLLFIIPIALSDVQPLFEITADKLLPGATSTKMIWIYPGVEYVIIAFLIYWMKGTRLSSLPLVAFCVIYAWAGMIGAASAGADYYFSQINGF